MAPRNSWHRGTTHAANSRPAWSDVLLLCAAMALLTTSFAYDCDSGILQMKPLNPEQRRDNCFSASHLTPPGPNTPAPGSSFAKAACTWALRVRVKNGVVKIVPLVQKSYYVPDTGLGSSFFNCKDANASGTFYPGSTTSASVMLYDDYGGPLSNLTKTGAHQISLILAKSISTISPSGLCVFNYTVVQGCVFGIKAPAKPATTCPTGYIKTKGRFGKSYCAPCDPGTYYNKATSSCKPCAIGTYSQTFGATKCTKCDAGSFTNVTGSSQCDHCETYDKHYTNGRYCKACPKGSYPSSDVNGASTGRCYRCDAGKKCCTVGWTKSCPKCTGAADPKTYTSIFALETATPPSCFTTRHALCGPKITITVDPTCTISLSNNDYSNNPDDHTDCSLLWSTTVPVAGAKLSITDIVEFDYDKTHFTATASPYLTTYIPGTKCTLRYRALTAPLATLLGAAPKPTKATSCPAGQYLETNTDAKPGPCLRCPPGTYSPRASSGRKCFRCPAGTYANRYGSTSCKRCPVGNRVSSVGSAWCSYCDSGYYPLPGGKGCKACPKDSESNAEAGSCLGNAYGTVCCAAGNCTAQPHCKGPRASTDLVTSEGVGQRYTAILQLVSKSVAQPACKNATFLSCLPVHGKVQVYSYSTSPLELYMKSYRTKFTCGNYTDFYHGHYASAKTAFIHSHAFKVAAVAPDWIEYALKSDSSKGTITMYLSPSTEDMVQELPKAPHDCSATFKIVSGFAFDLSPPADAKCDPADGVYTYGGHKFCQPCWPGKYKNSTGMCGNCPAGTHNDVPVAASCKVCKAGYSCSEGLSIETCADGYYSSKPGQAACAKCPKNTFGSATIPTTKCTACPKGTIAPEAATACGVPWDKKFPA